MPGQIPRTNKIITIYLRNHDCEERPEEQKGWGGSQLSHASNWTQQQTVLFAFLKHKEGLGRQCLHSAIILPKEIPNPGTVSAFPS